ncbi:MAG TPA: hypothetical protein VIP11_09290 [Gemmatimonadaceae bacterium]
MPASRGRSAVSDIAYPDKVVATVATRALTTMLFGIARFDAVTCVEVVVLLCGVSVIACAVPAWRAARIDAGATLRSD